MTTPPSATQPSVTPPPPTEKEAKGRRHRPFGEILREAIQENTVTVTVLALFSATVIGGLLTAFTNTTVLHAWGDFFSAPGNAIARAWDAAAGTYLRINAGFLIALACALGAWWLLNRTTTGFEFRSAGANASASRVAGMNVERNWALVMAIGGGLAGLAASTVILGTDFTLNPQSCTYGIDAITVALLGLGRPGGVAAAGLLFGALHAGSPGMQTATGTPVQIVQVLQALIVMFVAAPPLVRAIYRLRAARAGGVGTTMSKGWNA
jgi:ABC-type uncharacterized transport system permease subunit